MANDLFPQASSELASASKALAHDIHDAFSHFKHAVKKS